jgi:Ca-activated chloride channel homolog
VVMLICGIIAYCSFSIQYSVKDSVEDAPAIVAQVKLEDKAVDGIDVSEQLRNANGLKMQPSKQFRAGHVSKTSVSTTFTKTENGFVIQLPGSNNVPTPGIYNGNVYVSGGFGSKEYFAFDAVTGDRQWAVALDDDGPSSPAIEDGIIVYNTESCTIFASNAETGNHLWSYYLGDPLMSMPAISNGKVFTAYPCQENSRTDEVKEDGKTYTMRYTHVLIAFDLKTGKILWQKWIDGDIMSSPVADGRHLYVTTFPGTVYKFNQDDGSILSAKYMRATSAPIVSDEEMIVSRRVTEDAQVFEAITQTDASKMEVKRQYGQKHAAYLDKQVQSRSKLKSTSANDDAGNGFSGGAPATSGASAAEENIGQGNVSSLQSFQGSRILKYRENNFNTMGDEIVCTDGKSGAVKWKSKFAGDINAEGGFLGTPPLIAGGKIIVATLNGEIQVLNSESGKKEMSWSTGENIRYQPVVDRGWIYATTTNGKMIAINTGNASLTGWSMWGKDAAHTNVVR